MLVSVLPFGYNAIFLPRVGRDSKCAVPNMLPSIANFQVSFSTSPSCSGAHCQGARRLRSKSAARLRRFTRMLRGGMSMFTRV